MLGITFYNENQSVPSVNSFAPSAGKPAEFMSEFEGMHYWERHNRCRRVTPATLEDLYLVHDKAYVDGVFDGTFANGFGNTDPRVPPACLWTVGSMVSAALFAPESALPTLSPTSGFHHAGHAFGEGFCTFNGLLVAAARFIQAHPSATVGILDCDFHYGNGTADILARNKKLAKHVIHHTSGKHFHKGDDPDEFFLWLQESIDDLNANQCDLVLYQAGADMHINDPLGGLLDDAQMRQRDRMVFRKVRAPIVWNLAGGYRRDLNGAITPVIKTHMATLAEANMSDGTRHAIWEEDGR